MPSPVRKGSIDQQREQDNEQYIRLEADTLSESTGDKGWRDDRELKLEEGEKNQGNCSEEGCIEHAREHEIGRRISDQAGAAEVVTKSNAKTHYNPHYTDHAHGHKALQHGRNDVLGVDHTTIEVRQTRRHEQ